MNKLSQDEINSLFDTACDAARQSGSIIKKHFGKQKKISYKGRIDLVTDVDYKSEETIINVIKSSFPEHDIITEESDPDIKGSSFRWIIDPVDGTVNYAHNYPFVAVSIALEVNGSIEIGVVYNPLMEEFFFAKKGQGAFCNNVPITVSETESLEKSLLATGFPYDIKENSYNNLAFFNHLIMRAQAIRRDGSAALNLCYLAMGRFDGYWEIRIYPWDIAAGCLITTEAGGVITDLNGESLSIYDNEIVATNGKIHNQLLKEIEKVKRDNIT